MVAAPSRLFAQSQACPAVAHQSESGSSALITYLVALNTDTFGITISLRQEELNTETWRKQPSFDNHAIFLYSYSNQPGRPNQQHRIDVTSRLLF